MENHRGGRRRNQDGATGLYRPVGESGSKGFKQKEESQGESVEYKLNTYYLDIPLALKASHDLGNNLKMFGAIGPYLGLGITGKIKASGRYQGATISAEEDIKWGNMQYEDDMKRLDMGMTFGAGLEVNNLLFSISYDLGLANISSYQKNGTKFKNRVLKFSAGYKIGAF